MWKENKIKIYNTIYNLYHLRQFLKRFADRSNCSLSYKQLFIKIISSKHHTTLISILTMKEWGFRDKLIVFVMWEYYKNVVLKCRMQFEYRLIRLEIDKNVVANIITIQILVTDDYKFCCQARHSNSIYVSLKVQAI